MLRFKHSSSVPVTLAWAMLAADQRKVGAYRPVLVLGGAQAGPGLREERGRVGEARRVRGGDVEEEHGLGRRRGGGGRGRCRFWCALWADRGVGGGVDGWWWAGYILDRPGGMIHRRTYTPLGTGARPTRPDHGPRVLWSEIFPGPHLGINLTTSRRAQDPRS